MSIHLIKGTGAPTTIPIEIGCHYIDTTNKKSYIAVGTSSIGDWRETGGSGGGGGGAVDSVFGRIGTITAQAGDYTAAQVGAYTTAQVDTALAGKVSANAAITGATKTKITYDSKGLVVAGADIAPTDIPSFTGASAGSSGTNGGVPAPTAGDQLKFLRADGTWQTVSGVTSVNTRTGDVVLTSSDVGLANVNNTSDADKPISSATQTALNAKVTGNAAITGGTFPKITYDAKGLVISGAILANTDIPAFTGATASVAGTGGGVPAPLTTERFKFLRGDGTWHSQAVASVNGQTGDVVLTKDDVGLSLVDNTSDASKPISTATQTALDAKVTGNAAITGGTFPKITFDSKGLVTLGQALSPSDLPVFTGSTAPGSPGTAGGVPAPLDTDSGKFLKGDGTWGTPSGGGGGTPGGSNTHIQFNNNGSFGGTANLTWDGLALNVQGSDVGTTTPGFTVRGSTGQTTFQVRNTGILTGGTLDTGTVGNSVRIGVSTSSTVNHADNISIGRAAGVGSGTGNASSNVFIGATSGNKITTGARNVAVGTATLNALTGGADNAVLGHNALRSITSFSGCTAVGSNALGVTTGSSNTGLGINAGAANLDGTNNLFIGASSANLVQYVNNCVYIGANTIGTNGTAGVKTSLEIVIGVGASGRGTGTTTIGTASNTSTQLWGDIFMASAGKGIRLISPDGSVIKTLTIDNTGAIALL